MAKEDLDKYYKLLEVKPETSWEEIKRTYRDLIKVWHPDRFANDTRLKKLAEEKTKEINFAFKKLEEDHLSIKFSYDNFGGAPEPSSKPPEKPATEQKKETGKKKSSAADIKRQAKELFKKARAMTSGNYRSVVDYLDQAIELDPFFEEAYVERGMAHIELKEFSLAIEDFNEAIKLNNQFFESFRGRATAQFELGNYKQAIKDFTTAIEMEPSQHPALYFYRGKAYERAGFEAEATMDFRKNERLLRSEGNEPSIDPIEASRRSKRSFWVTNAVFLLILCLIFTALYISFDYISNKNKKREDRINTTEKTIHRGQLKDTQFKERRLEDYAKRKYDAITKSPGEK